MARTTLPRHVPGVLIVEDEPSVRSFLRSALESRARVLEAPDGERAIEILRARARRDIDLVLMDYKLPRCSGLDVLQETKHSWPWIPVVMITAFGSEELAVQAFRGGASDYLTKPVQLQTLMRTVGTLVNTRRARPRASRGRNRDAGAVDPRIRQALAFLRQHFAEAITLTSVARDSGLSRFHFCRLFHRDTGRRFHDYLRELRLTRAKVLLADHHRPVTEVAYAVGYRDLSHFDTTFRKIVGQSPTQYRASRRAATS